MKNRTLLDLPQLIMGISEQRGTTGGSLSI